MNRTFLVELLESRRLLSGGLDSTFGTNGVVSGAVNYLPGGQAQSMVLQPDGRIVIAANEGPEFSDPAHPRGWGWRSVWLAMERWMRDLEMMGL